MDHASYASRQRRVSLCETLDRVLNKGAVITGDLVISIADIELLYVGVNLVVTSVETMRNWARGDPCPSGRIRVQEKPALPTEMVA